VTRQKQIGFYWCSNEQSLNKIWYKD